MKFGARMNLPSAYRRRDNRGVRGGGVMRRFLRNHLMLNKSLMLLEVRDIFSASSRASFSERAIDS